MTAEVQELLRQAQAATDEMKFTRVAELFSQSCKLTVDPKATEKLFVEGGIPRAALRYPAV